MIFPETCLIKEYCSIFWHQKNAPVESQAFWVDKKTHTTIMTTTTKLLTFKSHTYFQELLLLLMLFHPLFPRRVIWKSFKSFRDIKQVSDCGSPVQSEGWMGCCLDGRRRGRGRGRRKRRASLLWAALLLETPPALRNSAGPASGLSHGSHTCEYTFVRDRTITT